MYRGRRRASWTCLALMALALAPYARVSSHSFLRLDDDEYITDNPHVREGLTQDGIVWAFTHAHADNWHPLTWISHMVDCEVFGLHPAGHHWVNVGLHAASTVLLFLALRLLTGAFGASVVVAALFAVHPLRVEAVAWAAERKEVLAGLFFMLTLLAYGGYARRPGAGRYLLVGGSLALGLMAKPTLVTVPFVLLLLDVWPLGRLTLPAAPSVVLEKVPLLALSVASSAVTLVAQKSGGALGSFAAIPLGPRIGNAVLSYGEYLRQTIWPAGLAVFYPHAATYPSDRVATLVLPALCAGVVLALVSFLVARGARRRPCLAVGWCWYLGMLVPMIGIVQVGMQARADRYTYLPLIGIYVLAVWGIRDLARGRVPRAWLSGATVAVVAVFAALTWEQVGAFRDDVALYEHALRVTSDNYLAHNNLGVELLRRGRASQAEAHFEAALRIKPDYADALGSLGTVRMRAGDYTRAKELFELAVRIAPRHARAHSGLGGARLRLGDRSGAVASFERALVLDPRVADAHNGLGVARMEEGRLDEAASQFRSALSLRSDYPDAHCNLGKVLRAQGKLEEAAAHQREALRFRPDYAQAHHELGLLLAARGDLDQAVAHLRRAVELAPADASAQRDLASLLSRPR